MKYLVLALLLLTSLSQAKTLAPRELERKLLIATTNKEASFTSDSYVLSGSEYALYGEWDQTSAATWEGTIQLQASADNSNWTAIASTDVTMSSSGNTFWNVSGAGYLYGRVSAVVTAGSANINLILNTK